jgi:AsmA protein
MGRLLKWLFGVLFFLVILVVVAVVVLPMLVDPNDYKGEIIARVKQETGRDLRIRDPLELSVFPALAVRLGGVSLSNAPGFGEAPFAAVEELDLNVKLMPLLSKRVEVDTVVLRGLGLSLGRDASGKTNWHDLIKESEHKDKPAAPQQEASASGGGGFSFAVQGIQVEDASVAWNDRQAGQKVTVDGVRLVTGSLAPGANVPVEGGFKLVSEKPQLTLQLGVDGTVALSGDLQRYNVDNLRLNLDAAGEGLPPGGIGLALTGNLAFDQGAGTLQLRDLAVKGPQVQINGELNASGLNADPSVAATLRLQETNLKNLLASFGTQIETTDETALTRASGELGVKFSGGALGVAPLKIKLDDSNLDGEVKIASFAGPTVRATVNLDEIDLDRYLPPPRQVAASDGKSEGAATDTKEDPFAALRTLDLDAKAVVGKLKINNLHLSGMQARIVSKNGVLTVDPAQANLYQGAFKGLVQLDARQAAAPKLRAKNALTGIQIGPLLQDLTGQDRLLGVGDVNADLRMTGLSEPQIRKTLNGTASIAFRDGAYKGINLADVIRQAKSALGMETKGATSGDNRTDFSELSASAKITNGVIDNQDLKAKSPLLRVEGKGEVNLPQDSIDYLVVTEIVESLEGQGGKARDELRGLPIPVRLKGSLQDPKPSVDLQAALSTKAKQQLEEKKQEVTKQIEKKAKEQINEALKGLFK